MPNLHVSVRHSLSKKIVVQRIKSALGVIRREHQDEIDRLEEEWIGDKGIFHLVVRGFDLMGSIDISENNVLIKSKLPWPLSLYKLRIEKIIKDKVVESLRLP